MNNTNTKSNRTELPRADLSNYKATYENYEIECPVCKKWNVFNRITDIKSIGTATGKAVECFYCKRSFMIIGDEISELYEYFLDDCDELIRQKRYMQCIVSLCQACEAFFMKCIEIRLLWDPYRNGVFGFNEKRYKIFDEYYQMIHEKFKKLTYRSLLNIFFHLYLNNKLFTTQNGIVEYLKQIDIIRNYEPRDEEIKSVSNTDQQKVLFELKRLNIHEIRNDVVHKNAYRPNYHDVKYYREKIEAMIEKIVLTFYLTDILKYCALSNVIESLSKRDST